MVTNVLKTGEVVADLKGHIVKRADVPMVYEILEKGEQINGKYSRVNRQSRGNRAGIARI
jgi:hypothetical protein